jgi:hypothetical protein
VGQIVLLAGNDVGMDMGDALAGVDAVLDGDVQGGSMEDALDGARDALHSEKQVLDLRRREVVEARNNAAGRDEDVAGQQGLEVD